MIDVAIILVSSLFLLAGSISDLRTTEVPDKISLGFILLILLASIIHSAYARDFSYFSGTFLLGGGYFLFGLLLFFLGQWGGGDVKIFAGIGCTLAYLNALGFAWPNSTLLPYYVVYFINLGLVAIPSLLFFTMLKAVGNQSVVSEFILTLRQKRTLLLFVLSVLPSVSAAYVGVYSLAVPYLILPVFTLMSVFLKVSEKVLFRRKISPSEIKVGDVLADDILFNNEKVFGKSTMEGLDESQLQEFRRLMAEGKIPSEVTLKLGVVFIPIYFISFFVMVFVGNPVEALIVGMSSEF